jgi:hypothetical protein
MEYLAKSKFTTKASIDITFTCYVDAVICETNRGKATYKVDELRSMIKSHKKIFGPKIGKEFEAFITDAYTPKQLDMFS